jgi:hypothetical protein
LCAAHAGHFLRDHFRHFGDVGRGKLDTTLVSRVLGKGHARAYRYWRKEARYHLFNHALYRRLGFENSNFRRRDTSLTLVNQRLVGFDFIIDHLDSIRFFETVPARVAHFTQLGIPERVLPAKTFTSLTEKPVTVFFIDKFPMGVAADNEIVFSYCDDVASTLNEFENHIQGYLPLFRALSSGGRAWSLRFISALPSDRIDQAREVFERLTAITDDAHDSRLARYFVLKDLYLRKQWLQLTNKQDLIDRIELSRIYDTPHYELLFERWRAGQFRPVEQSGAVRQPGHFSHYFPSSSHELSEIRRETPR